MRAPTRSPVTSSTSASTPLPRRSCRKGWVGKPAVSCARPGTSRMPFPVHAGQRPARLPTGGQAAGCGRSCWTSPRRLRLGTVMSGPRTPPDGTQATAPPLPRPGSNLPRVLCSPRRRRPPLGVRAGIVAATGTGPVRAEVDGGCSPTGRIVSLTSGTPDFSSGKIPPAGEVRRPELRAGGIRDLATGRPIGATRSCSKACAAWPAAMPCAPSFPGSAPTGSIR